MIKTESVNHPLFRVLLEEAEKEYGFVCAGPLTLPCDVAVFRRIIEALGKGYLFKIKINLKIIHLLILLLIT